MMLSTRSEVCSGATFKAAADMADYEFAGVFLRAFIGFGVFALVQQQVIAYTAADK